ncbi:MAG: polyprenyl synthetase family protein [Gemmatimonadaceae bacterium]
MSGVIVRPRTPMTDALRGIQAPVRHRLDLVLEAMQEIVSSGVPIVEQVSHHLLGMRGKMFRPTLTLLSSDLEGRAEPRVQRLAAVIELMHLATLVHDDSVDHSATRRGLPTVNSMFSHQVSVIMGDFLYSRALRALVAIRDFDVLRVVTDVSSELSMGEMRQLSAIDALTFGEPEYELMVRAKTASLISAACESGALCGAARFRDRMARFGDRLGMAFQVVDDILDYTEDASVTGKPSGNDLREHKVTLPLIAVLPDLSAAARQEVERLFAADEPTDVAIETVVGIVAEAGGIEYARRRSEQYAQEAEDALQGVPESAARASLVETIAYVTDRRW